MSICGTSGCSVISWYPPSGFTLLAWYFLDTKKKELTTWSILAAFPAVIIVCFPAKSSFVHAATSTIRPASMYLIPVCFSCCRSSAYKWQGYSRPSFPAGDFRACQPLLSTKASCRHRWCKSSRSCPSGGMGRRKASSASLLTRSYKPLPLHQGRRFHSSPIHCWYGSQKCWFQLNTKAAKILQL